MRIRTNATSCLKNPYQYYKSHEKFVLCTAAHAGPRHRVDRDGHGCPTFWPPFKKKNTYNNHEDFLANHISSSHAVCTEQADFW